MDGGNACTTIYMSLMTQTCVLKNGYNGNFYIMYFTTMKKIWEKEHYIRRNICILYKRQQIKKLHTWRASAVNRNKRKQLYRKVSKGHAQVIHRRNAQP